MPARATDKLQVVVNAELVRRLDEWRRMQADLPNRSLAIRRMIERVLEQDMPPAPPPPAKPGRRRS
jgi:hypothetical protein